MGKDILYPLRLLHGKLYQVRVRENIKKTYKRRFKEQFKRNSKTVLLAMTPEHGNLGDHAIALAEYKLLNNLEINVLDITDKEINILREYNLLKILNGFPIIIHGGGNLGTLWFGVEKLMREIVINAPKSEIFFCPNTIYYEDSEYGKREFNNSMNIYNSHANITFVAREKTSYSIMKKAYCNVKLVPDMVLLLNKSNKQMERKGCLLCLRGDKEKTRTEEMEVIIQEQAKDVFDDCVYETDMIFNGNIKPNEREERLNSKFDEFLSTELVITDRLHGMIFSAITGTPCIVINSKSPKVKGCYEWIKNLDYIRFVDDVNDISKEYYKIPKKKHFYDNSHLLDLYNKFGEDILRNFNWS